MPDSKCKCFTLDVFRYLYMSVVAILF